MDKDFITVGIDEKLEKQFSETPIGQRLDKWIEMPSIDKAYFIAKVLTQPHDGDCNDATAARMWAAAQSWGMAAKSLRYLIGLSGVSIPTMLEEKDVLSFSVQVIGILSEASPDELCLAVVSAFEEK